MSTVVSTSTSRAVHSGSPFREDISLGEIMFPKKLISLSEQIRERGLENRLERGFDPRWFPCSLRGCTQEVILVPCRGFMKVDYFDGVVERFHQFQLGRIDHMIGLCQRTDKLMLRARQQFNLLFPGSHKEIDGCKCVPRLEKNTPRDIRVDRLEEKFDEETAVVIVKG